MNLELQTERLVLRPLIESDLSWCTDMLTDPEVVKYLYEQVPTVEDIVAELPHAVSRGASGRIGIWAITLRNDHTCIGTTFLLPLPVEANDTEWHLISPDALPDREIEIGYVLQRAYWGRGYSTEAAGRLIDFAFKNAELDEVVAITHPDNTASRNVLGKIGFVDEGIRRAYAVDCQGFRLTREKNGWLCGSAHYQEISLYVMAAHDKHY